MIDFTSKVALITGGARGIGASCARLLAEAGAKVLVTDLDRQVEGLTYETAPTSDLERTVQTIRDAGGEAEAAYVDVRDIDGLKRVVAQAMDTWGRLDTVVANAGVASWPHTTWEASQQQWDTMINVTMTGTWNTVRAAVPAVLAGGRGGAFVFIGSIGAVRPMPTNGHYGAAKAGLVALAKSFALELAADSIRFTVVHPGGTSTYMTENPQAEHWQATFGGGAALDLPMPIKRMEPDDIGYAVRWLASDEARYITGTELIVDAGATL